MELYVKELYEAGRFDLTLASGEKVKPASWRSKINTVQQSDKVVEQMKFPDLENQAVMTDLGTSPYYFRVDLMTMLLLPSVTMYDPNYISKLTSFSKDDGFKMSKDGVYSLTVEEYYRKADVLKMAEKFCYLGNAHGTEYEIPPTVATNVLGFALLNKHKTMPEFALEMRRADSNFMRLAIDVASWPIEALLIDLAIMDPTQWNDMYSDIVQVLMILLTTGLVNDVEVDAETDTVSAGIVGIYSLASTSIRAHSITYDAMRVKYVSKFAQILHNELVRIGFREASPPMSDLMAMFSRKAYELLNTSKGQSEIIVDNALCDIVKLVEDMKNSNEDTVVLESMLQRKRRELAMEICTMRTVKLNNTTKVRPAANMKESKLRRTVKKSDKAFILRQLGVLAKPEEASFIADMLNVEEVALSETIIDSKSDGEELSSSDDEQSDVTRSNEKNVKMRTVTPSKTNDNVAFGVDEEVSSVSSESFKTAMTTSTETTTTQKSATSESTSVSDKIGSDDQPDHPKRKISLMPDLLSELGTVDDETASSVTAST